MAKEQPSYQFVSQVDIVAGTTITQHSDSMSEFNMLVKQLIATQNRQNELLEEIVEQLGATQRQRSQELAQWKQTNPHIARACKYAADKLGQIQNDFILSLADDVADNYENLQESEYYFNDFIDKYGPRSVHLGSILQLLATLGNAPDVTKTVTR